MKTYFRPLTIQDKTQLLDLFNENPKVYTNFTDEDFQAKFAILLGEELANPLCFFPGIFIENKLHLSIYLKEVTEAPSFILGHIMFKKTSVTTFLEPEFFNQFINLDKAIYDEMVVKRQLNRIYCVYPIANIVTNRSIGAYNRLCNFIKLTKNHDLFFTKFDIYTDCIVKKNTIPKYKYQQLILGNRTWPIDLALQIGFLSQKSNGSNISPVSPS